MVDPLEKLDTGWCPALFWSIIDAITLNLDCIGSSNVHVQHHRWTTGREPFISNGMETVTKGLVKSSPDK